MADYTGQQLGNYRLRQVIGQGGSADVYLGEHIHLGTLAAIKVLHIQIGSNELDEFLREARTIAHLRHPHIVRVLDFGVEGNMPFLVMDYATNGTLRQSYPKGTHLPLATTISYVKQVAQALQYAHDRKVVHRDVKPENMLLDINSQLLLSDFGISGIEQHTNTLITQKRISTNTAGTIYYMAPEQILGHPHPSSDQYALGVVVYEWLCGACPFSGDTLAVMYQHVHMPPLPLRAKISALSPAIEQVVLRALAKDPGQRFATIGEFAQALEQADQAQEEPTLFTQWHHELKPISIAKPIHQRKGSSMPGGMAMLLIGLALILVVGSVAFLLSSFNNYSRAITTNNHSRATATIATTAINAYDADIASGVMAGFNAQHTRVNPSEKILTSANVSKLVLAWKVATGGGIGSAATVANGIVYINSNGPSHDGYMYALTVNKGAFLWKAYIGSYDFGCAPTVANGVVYMGSFDDNLYAFNATTGAKLWQAPTKGRIGSSPTLANGVIYIGSDDGILYAFNASNGRYIWSVPTGSVISSSPAFANGLVYVGSDDHKLYAINANNGTIRWTFTTGDQVVSSPTVANGAVYIGSNDHTFYALDADTGKVLWKVPTGGSIMSSPAVANGIVYIGSEDHKLHAFDAVNGTPLWMASTGSSIRSSPTVANGLVYVGSDDHKLYAINADDGTIRWTFTTGDQVVSSPTVANGAVYIGSNDGNLYAFHLAGGTP
jgi:outer membrane protein assembly factor BamB/tRNA A-37 threonylcarbamoyl transferase component Bud32